MSIIFFAISYPPTVCRCRLLTHTTVETEDNALAPGGSGVVVNEISGHRKCSLPEVAKTFALNGDVGSRRSIQYALDSQEMQCKTFWIVE